MKIARFIYKDKVYYGEVAGDRVKVIEGSVFQKFTVTDKKLDISQIRFIAPVCPTKVVAVGLNYIDHAKEMNLPVPEEPVIFIKPATSVIGHEENIIYPDSVRQLDYEAELAIIVRNEISSIEPKEAKKHILGYTCLNDVTARDLQKKDGQWTRAKSFDTFCPIGPYIVNDVNPDNLSIKLYLNDEIKQSSNTKNLIFKVDFLVSFISKVMTLYPGDVISTGTPAGIGPMKPGDAAKVEIEGIGVLKNTVISSTKI